MERDSRFRSTTKGTHMNLPQIDISALPDLTTLTGVFGSLAHHGQAITSDDTTIVIMVFIYEILQG